MESTSGTEAVRYLSKSFRAGVALRAALDSTFTKFGCMAWGTASAQRELLNETVFYTHGLPDGVRYPFGAERCARFVRLVMDEIDRMDEYELDEEVAEHAAGFCQRKGETHNELAYVVFEIGKGEVGGGTRDVVIRVSREFNELGRRVWEAGVVVCAQLMHEGSVLGKWFRGRRVLEIGGGTGVSAAGYSHAGVEYALLTDHDGGVVENMRHNIERNWDGAGRVEWGVLEAGDVDEVVRVADEQRIDTVVAADVTYDEELVVCIVNGLKHVVVGDRVGLLVVMQRNEKTTEVVWRELESAGLVFEKVECVDVSDSLEYLVGWEFSRVSVYRVRER